MSTAKRSALPTAAEIRGQIDQAEEDLTAANRALGEALFAKSVQPDRDISAAQAAVDAARQRRDQLQAMLPIAENAEGEALAETRAKLAEEKRRRLAKELEGLVKPVLQFSAAYQNAVSAWRRGCDAIDRARALLPAEMRRHGLGWERRLSAHWLHEKCTLEIARLGLVPVTDRPSGTGVLSAPGARADAVNTLRQASSPQTEQRLKAALQADGYAVPPLPSADRLRQIESQATALRAERRSYYAGLMAAADWRLAMARTRPGDKPPLAGAVSMALRVVASLLRSLSLLPLPR